MKRNSLIVNGKFWSIVQWQNNKNEAGKMEVAEEKGGIITPMKQPWMKFIKVIEPHGPRQENQVFSSYPNNVEAFYTSK